MIPFVASTPEQASMSEAEMRQACREQYEECLEKMVGAMRIEDASAFRNLRNSYSEHGFGLSGIAMTNGYSMKFDDEVDDILTYHVIGDKGSRINHR